MVNNVPCENAKKARSSAAFVIQISMIKMIKLRVLNGMEMDGCQLTLKDLTSVYKSRAESNSRSSDIVRPNFANVRRNRRLGRTFCPANFLLQHLTISFTNKI